MAKKLCRKQPSKNLYGRLDHNVSLGSQLPSIIESPCRMDTYDTFTACKLSEETAVRQSHNHSSDNDVKLPLTPKKDSHRRSFLEQINSFGSVKLCRSKSRRTTFTEQSFYGSTKAVRSSGKSPFSRKLFLRTSFRGFKKDKVADVNNNGHFQQQSKLSFGVTNQCTKETHF